MAKSIPLIVPVDWIIARLRSGVNVLSDLLVADAICFDVAYDEGIGGQVARGAELVTVQTSNAMFSEHGVLELERRLHTMEANELKREMQRLVPEYTPYLD